MFYAVAAGRVPGIYTSWDECKQQTTGFSGACFKKFSTRQEASGFIASHTITAQAEAPTSKRAPEEEICRPAKRHATLPADAEALLSVEQQQALGLIADNQSVFITGPAGVGKSFLLKQAIAAAVATHGEESLFVTASTGVAALQIGGTTLHHFAGVGLGDGSRSELVQRAKRHAKRRWRTAHVLVIDEISMIDAAFFDDLEFIACSLRGNSLPFGGIQLIAVGDFFQLPPVGGKPFCFEAASWSRVITSIISLTKVFRQADSTFVELLSRIRYGECSAADVSLLLSCYSNPVSDHGIEATVLYPRRVDVAAENAERLAQLTADTVTFVAVESGTVEFFQSALTPKVLELKIGAQVMCTKNLDNTIANGSRGIVIGFATLERCNEVSHPDLFKGVGKRWREVNLSCMFPVVQFLSGKRHLMTPSLWTVTSGVQLLAERAQVPLMLAWAVTIHKAQGLTLDLVQTSLADAFDYGMVYVALSRVRSLQGLRLLSFERFKVRANPKVLRHFPPGTDVTNNNCELPR